MKTILEEMTGKKSNALEPANLLLKIEDLEKRIEKLEKINSYGGVYVDGSTQAVKDYYANLIEAEKKQMGGSVDE